MKKGLSLLIIVMVVFGFCLIAGAADTEDNVQLLKAEKQLTGSMEAYKQYSDQRQQTAVIWQALNDKCVQLEMEIMKLQADIKAMQPPVEKVGE